MDIKVVLLPAVVFLAASLAGCQTLQNSQSESEDDGMRQINQVRWQKVGDSFQVPNDDVLEKGQRRVLFFREDDKGTQSDAIKIEVGTEEMFQAILQDGSYSDVIICSNSFVVNAEVVNYISGEVQNYSNSYDFPPQTTTYLQVMLSQTGKPTIQKLPTEQALVLLEDSTRHTHQISRVSAACKADNQVSVQQAAQFSLLFDFDSHNVSSSSIATLDAMAEFIQSYPNMDVVLEGHTDNKGPESYNFKLSQSRANNVKNILVNKYGLKSINISTAGYGETRPVDTNATKQGRLNNRRVVAIVSQELN